MKALFFILALLYTINSPITASTPDTLFFHHYASDIDGVKNFDMEDKIIVIVKDDYESKCFYYGTSDDFDEAREGYFPGFITLEANDLSIKGKKISFRLNSTDYNFYSQPIEIGFHTEAEIEKAGYKRWFIPSFNCWKDVHMEGTISKDSIIIENKTLPFNGPAVFYRERMEKIKSEYRRDLIDPKYERKNNIDFDGMNSDLDE